MNERPKHEVLRSLGAFMGGLGVLLAGIAILILAMQPPLCPVKSSKVPDRGRAAIAEE